MYFQQRQPRPRAFLQQISRDALQHVLQQASTQAQQRALRQAAQINAAHRQSSTLESKSQTDSVQQTADRVRHSLGSIKDTVKSSRMSKSTKLARLPISASSLRKSQPVGVSPLKATATGNSSRKSHALELIRKEWLVPVAPPKELKESGVQTSKTPVFQLPVPARTKSFLARATAHVFANGENLKFKAKVVVGSLLLLLMLYVYISPMILRFLRKGYGNPVPHRGQTPSDIEIKIDSAQMYSFAPVIFVHCHLFYLSLKRDHASTPPAVYLAVHSVVACIVSFTWTIILIDYYRSDWVRFASGLISHAIFLLQLIFLRLFLPFPVVTENEVATTNETKTTQTSINLAIKPPESV